MKKKLQAVVTGRVQAVLFRDFARRSAQSLGLVGTAENKKDGSVEILAEGEEEKLSEFLKFLNKGPFLAKVKNVSAKWSEPTGTFADFKIIYGDFWDKF